MRAGVHNLLLNHAGDFPLNTFGNGDIRGLSPGLFQGDNLFTVRALGHARILSTGGAVHDVMIADEPPSPVE